MKISTPPRANGTWAQDRDAHGAPYRFSAGAEKRETASRPATRCSKIVHEAERSSVEGALVVGERLDVPAHQLAEHRFDGCAESPAETRAQPERAVGGDGPETLGLGARGVAIVRPSACAGIGPQRRISSRSEAKSASTSTSSTDGKPLSRASSGTAPA